MSDIAQLFMTDPEKLTKENIDDIIAAYREARQQFNLGLKSAGSTKKVAGPSAKITNIDDLDI